MGYPALFVAILMMSIMLMHGTPSSLNPDKYRQHGDAVQLISTINSVVMDIGTYEATMHKRIEPDTWYDELKRSDALVPKSTALREWSMGENGDNRYLCVHQPASPTAYQLELFQNTKGQMDFDVILNADCGATSDWDGESELTSLSLTIYFKG